MTIVFALCWSIPLGVISAVRQIAPPIDYLARRMPSGDGLIRQ